MLCKKCGHEITGEVAYCPCCGEKVIRKEPETDEPLFQTDIRKVLKSGKLIVYRDRTEFVTSSVQKAIFNYSGLVAVKKEWDHIDFITEDGRRVSCPADRKCVHEAFLYIEQAVRPYLVRRKERLLSQGVHYSFPSDRGLLDDGVLNLSVEKAEFKARSGKNDVVSFRDVKSVSASAGTLDFFLFGGRIKSFAVSKELRDEVLAFAVSSIAPFLEQRKESLLARGIYFSFIRPDGGTVNILADRIESGDKSGQTETVPFQNVRAVSVHTGILELALTDGTSRSFFIDEDEEKEVLIFVKKAIEPYVTARTVGYDTAFGIDERIEINEERGVFHIIRQNGKEITDEWPLDALTRCEWMESSELTMLAKGIVLLKSAAKTAGNQSAAEDRISCAGAVVTICTGQESVIEAIRFGIFPAGMSRTSRKYERYQEEWSRFSTYLKRRYPGCELIESAPLERKNELPDVSGFTDAAKEEVFRDATDLHGTEDALKLAGAAAQQDDLGIARYIDGVVRFIGECNTPMTIALQGNRGSGENSTSKMLFNRLKEHYGNNLLWLNARQFSQGETGEALSVSVGKKLVGLFSSENSVEVKSRATNIASGVIKLVAGAIAPDSSAADNLVEGIFDRGSADSADQLVSLFSRKVEARGEKEKVILFIDGLEQLPPVREVELLDAMQDFLVCKGCVFVIAANSSEILNGALERYDERKAKAFFDKMFQMSFRVPESGYNISNYVKGKLENMGLETGDHEELDLYSALIQNSVGRDPESLERLFHSFRLLKNMVDGEVYQSRYKRMALFALLCMQIRFRDAYDYAVQMRDNVTPEFLTGLCGESARLWDRIQGSDDERAAYRKFGSVFAQVITLDGKAGIAEEECRVFAEVLELSSVTSR